MKSLKVNLSGELTEVLPKTSIGTDYDSTKTYSVGDYVVYDGALYRCTTAITTAEAWTAAHWTQVALADDVFGIKNSTDHVPVPFIINAVNPDAMEDGYWGGIGEPLSGNFKRSTEFTPCVAGGSYRMTYQRDGMNYFSNAGGGICFYDKAKNFITRLYNQTVFVAPANAAYMRFYMGNAYQNYPMVYEGTDLPAYYAPYAIEYKTSYQQAYEKYISESIDNGNLFDVLTGATKEWATISLTEVSGYYNNIIGIPLTASSWKYASINCKPNTIYRTYARGASGAFRVCVLDFYGRLIAHYPETAAVSLAYDTFVTPYNAAKIIINGNTGDNISIEELTGLRIEDSANILDGKKLYCGGDSITAGDNVGTFPDGYKKTYGGYVAERNNMVYVSDGIGGSCMGNVTIDGWNYHSFCVDRYTNIPTDADYITLWFGWNDNAYGWQSMRDAYCVSTYSAYYSALTAEQKAEVDAYKTWRQWLADYVGTVDSTSDTTWCGAWSKVLTWLLNNCPSARIGVVIAYGMNTELSDALIAVCEKYGVSYIKAYEPHEFFSVGHSTGIGADQATMRKSLYTLDNTHPNELGYNMMSASYEQFLRRI